MKGEVIYWRGGKAYVLPYLDRKGLSLSDSSYRRRHPDNDDAICLTTETAHKKYGDNFNEH
jgi:hypothetical protein